MLSQIYDTTIKLGTVADRAELDRLYLHPAMGGSAQLVYIYSLAEGEAPVPYQRAPGSTVYIGETKRETGAGLRFRAHISKSLSEGLSTNINHTVSVYYHLGRSLRLRVFEVADGRTTKAAERVLLQAHLQCFGAFPIGQGTSGKANTPCELLRIIENERECHQLGAQLVGGAI